MPHNKGGIIMIYSSLHVNGCKFKELEFVIKKATMKGLYESAIVLMVESQKEIPIDTRAAHDSMFINMDVETSNLGKVECGYGNINTKINPKTKLPTTMYLGYIHTGIGPDGKDIVFNNGKKKKFLENPFNRLLPTILAHVRIKVNKVINQGGIGG